MTDGTTAGRSHTYANTGLRRSVADDPNRRTLYFKKRNMNAISGSLTPVAESAAQAATSVRIADEKEIK